MTDLSDQPCMYHNSKHMTFREMLDASLKITAWCKQYDIHSDSSTRPHACIYMKRSFPFFVCIIGILNARFTYVPISTAFNEFRVKHIVDTTNPTSLFVNDETLHTFDCLVQYKSVMHECNTITKPIVSHPDDVMYVIFTSGTTGVPKGVMVEHQSTDNMITCTIETFKLSPDDRVIQFLNLSFDGTLLEYLPAFSVGAPLVLWDIPFPNAIKCIQKHKVTIATFTASILNLIDPNDIPSLRIVGQIGEPLTTEHVAAWTKSNVIIDMYGPTEACVYVTIKEFKSPVTCVTLGPCIQHSRLYLLDDKLETVHSTGTPSELYIGGLSLARGYLNDPEKTNAKFIHHCTHGRVYATGDFVEYTNDGIKYIGRMDNQVKIKGFRIELGEIIACLMRGVGVANATATVKVIENKKTIVGYITWKPGIYSNKIKTFLRSLLFKQAQNELFYVMVPKFIVDVDEIPITTTGKLDIRRLQEPNPQLHQKPLEYPQMYHVGTVSQCPPYKIALHPTTTQLTSENLYSFDLDLFDSNCRVSNANESHDVLWIDSSIPLRYTGPLPPNWTQLDMRNLFTFYNDGFVCVCFSSSGVSVTSGITDESGIFLSCDVDDIKPNFNATADDFHTFNSKDFTMYKVHMRDIKSPIWDFHMSKQKVSFFTKHVPFNGLHVCAFLKVIPAVDSSAVSVISTDDSYRFGSICLI